MPACELIIFDCDGTLMDSEMIAAEVETESIMEYGLEITPKEFISRFAGTSTEAFNEAMENELGRALPDDYPARVSQRINERLWREVKTVEGAAEVLGLLDQPRCVCSNASMEKLKIELTRGELWDRFRPYIFSANDLEMNEKPEPDVFLHAANEFDTNPNACAVVEDSVSGVAGARAAGMRVIGFTGGSHAWVGLADALTAAGAETVINKLVEIPQVIEAFELWDGMDA